MGRESKKEEVRFRVATPERAFAGFLVQSHWWTILPLTAAACALGTEQLKLFSLFLGKFSWFLGKELMFVVFLNL